MIADSTFLTRVYNDAGNVLTIDLDTAVTDARYVLAAGFDELVDDKVNALLVDSVYLTKSYNDAGNLLTLDADLAQFDARYVQSQNLSETVDDRVNALVSVTPNTGLAKGYDDAGNLLTLAGVLATPAAPGMMSAADKSKLDGATPWDSPGTLVARDAQGAINLGPGHTSIGNGNVPRAVCLTVEHTAHHNTPLPLVAFHAQSGNATNPVVFEVAGNTNNQSSSARGLVNIENNNPLSQTPSGNMITCFGASSGVRHLSFRVQDVGDVVVGRNLQVVGSITAAVKPFVIDHPLYPHDKMLRYTALEGPCADVLIRGRAQLVAGRAIVDLDQVARQSPGTLLLLACDLQAYAWNESRGPARWERIAWELEGATLTIESEHPQDLDVGFVVFGERQDAMMRHSELTDDDGHMIVEFEKPEADPAIMETRFVGVVADVAAEPVESWEPATEMLGTLGHPLHAEAFEHECPKRKVITTTVLRRAPEEAAEDPPS